MVRRDAGASILGAAATFLVTACGGSSVRGGTPDSGTSDVSSSGSASSGFASDDGATRNLSDDAGRSAETGPEAGAGASDGALPQRAIASKVDLLFMIDNSA